MNTLSKRIALSVLLSVSLFLHHVCGQTVVEGVVGGSVILPCTLTPGGDLYWKQGLIAILVKLAGGNVILGEGPYKGDVSLVNGDDLRINPLTQIRDGNTGSGDKTFECMYRTNTQQIQLRLLARITGVSIPEAIDRRVTVRAGTSTRLTCSVNGDPNPPPSYSWSVDGGTVSGQTSSQFTFSPNKSMRTIKCTATNRYSNGSVFSEKEVTAILNVQYLDPAKSPAPLLKVNENDKATLQCSSEGNPPLNYRWRGPGNSEVKSRSASYTIDNVHRSAAGEYKCSYNNTVGSDVLTANLVVEYPPDVTVSYDKTRQTLTCRAEGVPDSYTFSQWEHRLDGKLLQTLDTQHSGPTDTLRLPGTLTFEDTGYYVCQASNGIKSPQREQMFVMPQSAAVFEDQFRGMMATEGEIQAISVPFYTYSDTPDVKVVWEKSGESTVLTSHREKTGPVRLMIRGQSVSIEGTVTVLTLREVTQSDGGNYTVTVINDINGTPRSNQISFPVYVTLPPINKLDQTGSDVNIGAAVGGGIAGLVAVIIIVILSVLLFRKKRMKPGEAIRPAEEQTVVQFQNGRQEGGVYQDLTINPDYVNTTENQPYASLGEKGREAANYEQCDVPVNGTKQYEDLSFSTQEANPDYLDVYAENTDYENTHKK